MDIFFENHDAITSELPIIIFERQTDSDSLGCHFHWHEALEIYYVLSGGIHLLCNGENKWVYENEMAIINWCEPHKSLCFLNGTRHYIIQINLKSSVFKVFDNVYQTFLPRDSFIDDLICKIISEYNERKDGYQHMLLGYFSLFFGHLQRSNLFGGRISQNLDSLKLVQEILKHIHNTYTKPLSLDSLASSIGISKSYMCRIFKYHTDTTILKYANKLRCALAISLISQGSSVSGASAAVGFGDYNYFSRLFKKEIGHSPSYYCK
ncbi:MAG: AraC family transcriptional regulator [Firmicutes bacterium]|nr:AraC family transcriptional regulator [Bacillota bacterium]